MGKLLTIALAHLNRNRAMSITLAVMFVIASLLLNAGLTVLIDYGSHFSKLADELAISDSIYIIPKALHTPEVSTYLADNPLIETYHTEQANIVQSTFKSKVDDEPIDLAVVFFNSDTPREISQWKYLGEHNEATKDAVCVPYQLASTYGYALGDTIVLRFKDPTTGRDQTLPLKITGFIEDGFFMSRSFGIMSFYVPTDTYRSVAKTCEGVALPVSITYLDAKNTADLPKIESGFRDLLPLDVTTSATSANAESITETFDFDFVQLARTLMASVISLMLVLFATIIVGVCLLIVYFRITNSVEEDALKICSLKSVGYTSAQIAGSILLQFLILAVVGILIGIVASYTVLPLVSAILERQSGLLWVPPFDGALVAITWMALLGTTALVVAVATRHIRRLSPVSALRGESTTRRKAARNRLALERMRSAGPIVLGLKSMTQNVRQTVMILIILVAVSIAGVFGIIMYYNSSVDTKAFAEVPGYEIANVIVVINPASQTRDATIRAIESCEGVRKVQFYDEATAKVDDINVPLFIMADYAGKESNVIYEGHYPTARKEIALHGSLASKLGKEIGDTVRLDVGDKRETFRIVGLNSGINGVNASVLASDYRTLNKQFTPMTLMVYTDEGVVTADLVKRFEKDYSTDEVFGVIDADEQLATGMASYQDIVSAMGGAILVVTVSIIALVLYFVISGSIIRRRRELGIYKALGMTTVQLMNQFSVTFMVPVVIGAVLGSFVGARYTNVLMSEAMKQGGSMMPAMLVNPLWISAFSLILIAVSYLLAMLITARIRKISAYALVAE